MAISPNPVAAAHATRDFNRIADDAGKRQRLRASGHLAFQLTWDDLDLFEEMATRAEPVRPPYAGRAAEQARRTYEQLGGKPALLGDTVFTNPVEALLAYLGDPDPEIWAKRSAALVSGLAAGPPTSVTAVNRSAVASALRSALGGGPVPDGPSGAIHVLRAADRSGLPLVPAIDGTRGGAAAIGWTALAYPVLAATLCAILCHM